MKASLFVLGFLTGTLVTYLILTQLWWPDVRLQAARTAAVATPATSPVPPPSAFATPETSATEATANILPDEQMTPPIAQLTPSPSPVETPAIVDPPVETKSLKLPLLETDLDRLRERSLAVPVRGIEKKALRDTFKDSRGGRVHQAMDIMAPRGTPVLAVDDGRVEKLFTSKQGGLTIYQFDPAGEYCYYYAHLDSYAADVAAGRVLRKGDVIGYVGSTGNASPQGPHLHFTIFRLGIEKRWWEGTAINPFPLWDIAARP
jgi:murein DD-endopeptidase MepM/ murein hydrolase activator NlpD